MFFYSLRVARSSIFSCHPPPCVFHLNLGGKGLARSRKKVCFVLFSKDAERVYNSIPYRSYQNWPFETLLRSGNTLT